MRDTMGEERAQCRLPSRLNGLLEEAAEERGVFRSEVTRRALRYYVGVNPDEIEAFSGVSATGIRDIDRSNRMGSKAVAEPMIEAISATDTGETGEEEQSSVSEAIDEEMSGADGGDRGSEAGDDGAGGGERKMATDGGEEETSADGGPYDPMEDL